MSDNSKQCKSKIAIVGVGSTPTTFGVIAFLLQQGCTVIAPAQHPGPLKQLQRYLSGRATGRLVTMLVDFPDYDRVSALADQITEEYGRIDIVIYPFDYLTAGVHPDEIGFAHWQRAMEENLTVYFICTRLALTAMKERGEGLFTAIVDTDGLPGNARSALTDTLMLAQMQMARSFFEELKNTGVKFFHLFVNDLVVDNTETPDQDIVTPESIAKHILEMYHDKSLSANGPFRFLMGSSYSRIHKYFSGL
ncbi:MAG TPA: SDR family NAD(P)-dependent oxidoreductase [Puia sp.]|uniref:SDR family oxidoreductase n=1 Tax=Puia sp. TaxID=2045100 RepID=UPI002D0B4F09|nr:SDR family NAD(P)-dependent oxidoreductase [Puia sp.]HVU96389.1 SDR family NAD(P)-dependent oxidoreductase [Puia sp.]